VLSSNPFDRSAESGLSDAGFVLYVEGPSDCHILRTWAALVSRPLARRLAASAVILGGRRPARASQHFRELQLERDGGGLRGVCVLDRDGHASDVDGEAPEGLSFFTWPRRHIESYLLVPTALRRCMRMSPGDARLADLLGDLPSSGSEEALRSLDAKRLLRAKGALARELGSSLSPARIARCMRRGDLHPDVLELLDRLRDQAPGID
jgi:hypothetical protein